MIKVEIRGRVATKTTTDLVTSGSVGQRVKFIFSEGWDGLGKLVSFSGRTDVDQVLDENDEAVIPWECVEKPGKPLLVGIYGVNSSGEVVVPTIYCNLGMIRKGAEPTPSTAHKATEAVDQILAASTEAMAAARNAELDADEAAEKAIEAANAAKDAATSAMQTEIAANIAKNAATSAQTSANTAAIQAENAARDAATAQTAAQAAKEDADRAAAQARNASTKATEAAESAAEAVQRAGTAESKASTAAQSASLSASAAAQSASDARAAQSAASQSAGSAQTAQQSAQTAQGEVSKAQQAAQAAKNDADRAAAQAQIAGTKAIEAAASAAEAVIKVAQLSDDLTDIVVIEKSTNKYNYRSEECVDNSYLNGFKVEEDSRLKISHKIHVKKGDVVRFLRNSYTGANAGVIYNTDGNSEVTINSNGVTEEAWNGYTVYVSVSPVDGFYLINMVKSRDGNVNMVTINEEFPSNKQFVPYAETRYINESYIQRYTRPYDLAVKVLNGNYEEVYGEIPLEFEATGGYYNVNGKYFEYDNFFKAVVPVKSGEKYYLTSYNYYQASRAVFRNETGDFVSAIWTANDQQLAQNTEIIVPNSATEMHIYRLSTKRTELLGLKQYALIANQSEVSPLFGKKLVTAGDSYTHASFSGANAIYDSKNYGYYVAKRHGMTFVNSGISGSIMALDKTYVANPTGVDINTRNPFSYRRYLEVPEDTDYLTIWFGINDNANTNLGTIDDETNETFYGAWNTVLRYYLTNRPFMKVGLIVTVGASERYRQAVRDVAKKWGYPYLDWVNDDSIPAFFDRTGMSDEARNLRRQAFGYNDFSAHPNPQFHEYASTVYEKFLLSL